MIEMPLSGTSLLQNVAERILVRWLTQQGKLDVRLTGGVRSLGGRSVDLTYAWQGGRHRVTVKPDPYYGTDPSLISDRSLSFYRADASAYGLEAVANAATREPGWAVESDADDVYYYFLALSQAEDEVAAITAEPDEVFFSELAVGRDDLVVIPGKQLRTWFEANAGKYTSRPVLSGPTSAWYRMVPRDELDRAVPGIRHAGSVFSSLAR